MTNTMSHNLLLRIVSKHDLCVLQKIWGWWLLSALVWMKTDIKLPSIRRIKVPWKIDEVELN